MITSAWALLAEEWRWTTPRPGLAPPLAGKTETDTDPRWSATAARDRGADGRFFRWGVERKRALLEREKAR